MHNNYSTSIVFNSSQHQQLFELNGYVVIPFLNSEQVDKLRQIFFETHIKIPNGFYSSSFNIDTLHKIHINEKIESVIKYNVENHFKQIKKLGSCFLNKQPGVESEMPIHQDWTIVTEPLFDSITIWIPLQDVDEINGAIQVIEGSHRFGEQLRSPSLQDPFKNIKEELRRDLKLLKMKAGEAFIFSHALLHASPANMSSQPRIAVTYGLIDAKEQLRFYHKQETNRVAEYLIDENFFYEYNTQIGDAPKNGILNKVFEYQQHFFTSSEYQQMKQHFQQHKSTSMYKMIPVFKDNVIQQTFENEGYIILPLLNREEIVDLKNYYDTLLLKDEKGFGFHVSMDNADKEMCRNIRDKIWAVTLPKLELHLKNFKPFVASFIMKEVNPKGIVPAHQDWSFVDKEEDGYSSITCWVALVDTNLDNGGIGVIKGSHKFMQSHRPSPSPQCPVPLSEHMFSIFPYLKTLEVKAGEMLMFDNRTFHASPPNTSNMLRLAVGVGITQADANLVHYYLKPDGLKNTMLRYNVDTDFYLKYENATLSKMYDEGSIIENYGPPEEVPYSYTKYSTDDLLAVIKSAGNEYNIPMTEKLAKLFNQCANDTHEKVVEPIVNDTIGSNTAEEWIDDRKFFEKYSLINIAKEIKNRLIGS